MQMTDHYRAALADLAGTPYWLMDGAGNDFVILDLRRRDGYQPGKMTSDAAAALGDRDGPFGCDQIITLTQVGTDPFMGIWNADGSAAGACGNATRCVAWLLLEELGQDQVTLGSPAGPLFAQRAAGGQITVNMGRPKLYWEDIPLAEQMDDTRFIDIKLGPIDNPVLWGPSAVSMGNPHCVFFVDDVTTQALDRFGPLVENHPLFPEQANVTVAAVEDDETVRIRTWERGVGLTQACGTAACATAVSSHRRRLTGRAVTVKTEGGPLFIEWREADDQVYMTGPISLNGQGHLPDPA